MKNVKFFLVMNLILAGSAATGAGVGELINHEPHALAMFGLLVGAMIVFYTIDDGWFDGEDNNTAKINDEIRAIKSEREKIELEIAQNDQIGRRRKDFAREEVSKFMRCRTVN